MAIKLDIWGLVDNIAKAGDTIAGTYDKLVNAGIIKPAPGYVPPAPAPTPAPTVTKEPIYEKDWFFPVVMGGVIAGGLGFFWWAKKRMKKARL